MPNCFALPELLREARRGPLLDHEIIEALEHVGIGPARRSTHEYRHHPCMLLGMAALVMLNVPIAVALGVVAMAAIWIMQGTQMLPNTALVMFEGATNFPLLAVPLFILAGGIMNASSIARRLINLATAILGFIRGGLAMVTVGASMFFAEISGSAVADVAALGTLLIPAMKSRGYSKEFAAAVTSSSASLAIIIPPSIPMILYAAMAQESAVKLFVAGIIPGVIGGLALMALCFYYAWKYNFPVEQRFNLCKLAQAAARSSLGTGDASRHPGRHLRRLRHRDRGRRPCRPRGAGRSPC